MAICSHKEMKVNAGIAFEDPKGRGLISFSLNDTTNT